MWRTTIAVARLTRVYTALVAGIVAYALAADGGTHAAFAAASLALVLAGAFAFNDVIDRDADAINVPTRPIPSGALSARTALAIAIACDAAAIAAAIAAGSPRVVVMTCAMVAMLFAYSVALKRILFVKNVVMALVGASVPLFGSVPADAKTLAVTIGLFILQKEIAADAVDREGDARAGLRTLPVVFGVRRTMLIVAAMNVAYLASIAPMTGMARLALAAVGVTNIVFAIAARGEHLLRAYLVLQRVFLLAGVLFAWRR
jgi:geranylgeranylglycerol-phosphate geranylgeranyltransferase